MEEKLVEAKERFREIEELSATLPQNSGEYRRVMREYKKLSPVVTKYGEYEAALAEFNEAKELIGGGDAELAELAREQFDSAKALSEQLLAELRELLLPKDPDDDRNVVMEIRGGTGGEEAALFAHSLFRMYSMYAARQGFKIDVMNENETELGGLKEITFGINGENAYAKLKYESGVHRVQRVPETESQGRIHTSAATVAVLPEGESFDIEINEADLEFQACRSSGAGGQKVNKTSSAVRLTHKPSGIVTWCQSERSQLQNRETAMKMLYTKLYEKQRAEEESKLTETRRGMVGSGDRSERIRTYNFPQGRVTDHRIGLTLYKIDSIMNGECDEIFEALAIAANKIGE
ncbi:peptide chain release factor 1 [Clostridia bacterium]|nr:peptide chain release factor 1 [Clostridia bacterium]